MKGDSFNQISHPMSYYMENLQKLKDKLRDLGDYREIIRRKVSEANGRGDEIEVNVLHWQPDADSLLDDIEQLIRESTTKDNICSTECPCPDITWQYKFCKQAEEKIADADELIIKYNNFNQISDKNYVIFDSRASIFKDIMDALKDSNVNMIGVFGLGGVGKTTLVKEVGEQMRNDGTFKQVAMAVVSKDLNVKEVQSKLADSLNFEFKAKADDQEGRATELWNKFTNGDKYLIILDDIWEGVKMEAIGIPYSNEKKGCKVVLTSRNEDLLSTVMEVDRIFSIAILSSAEAWTLFMKKVGNSIQSQLGIQSLAYEVCKQCKGLPVAINALGEALKGKQEHAWKTALDKMDKYMLTKIVGIKPSVLASLRVSFDMLPSPDAKSCFLLCCLFAEDAEIPIDELMRLCVARNLLDQNPNTLDKATNAVRTMVDTLKSASLLTTDGHETVVKIHNVIRDVGISIAHEEEAFLVDHDALQWPRNPTNGPSYKAMSLSFKNNKRLPDGLVYQQLQTLMLDNSELSDVEVPDNFFNGMMQLTVLTFTRMRMRQLPSSLAKLTNLQMLNLNRCELENIAILKDLKFNLEVLSLRGSRIEALPPQIGQLIGLRLLDLRDCYQLKVIPRGVISNLTSLEELYFPKNFDKWEAITDEQQDTSNRGNVSLEELRGLLSTGQLTTLHVYIPDVMLLPKEDLIFANLKGFKISVGSEIKTSEEISGRCKLKLEGIQLRNEFIPLVDKAEVVILSKIEGLKKVFHDRGVGNRFLDLKYLKLGEPKTSVQSHGLHRLRSFNNLTVLIIEYCKLKYLFSPTTARGLVHLEELKVGCCEIMEGIVGFEERNDEDEFTSEVKFSKLKQLELRDLPSLLSFYAQKDKIGTTMGSYSACAQPLFSEKVIFLVLERLTINKLGNIIKIWDKLSIAVLEEQGSFCQLTHLEVRRCNKLIHVFPSNMHPLLKNLIELEVKECETMKGIAEFEGEIDEDGLRNEVASFAREHLEMVGVTEIQDKQPLPKPRKEVESLCKPMDIRIVKCDQLLYVFPSHMLPLNLQQLWIENCDKLEVIFSKDPKEEKEAINDDNIVFPRLERVILWHLPKLRSFYSETQGFFSHKVSLPNLEVLHVSDLENLERLGHGPLSAGSLSKLKEFSVRCCGKLLCVFPSQFLPMLRELQELTVESCHSLDVVFQLEGLVPSNILPNLQKLYVKGCPTIESIVFKNGKEEAADHISLIIPRLRYLRISDMENLKSFYSSSTASNAQSLFNHQVNLPVLEIFEVDRLGNIVEIWDKQSPWLNENTVSCSKLREMKVQRCKELMNLVPSNILPRLQNLQNLCVDSCPKIESMVFKNEKEEEAADDSALIIPQLRYLRISDMENLKSFYSSSTASNAQSLFNHQVAFPTLENLELEGCASLRYTFHPYMGVLVNLREIIIKHCSGMRAVVEDRQQRKTETTMFPNLSKLELHHLQELKLFCHYTRPLEFPLLRQMAICYCPSMDSFSLGHVRALDLSLKGITHKMGKMVKDGDDTTMTAQKNQEDVEPKNGGKKISGRISIEEV